jgi:hypothetical protein
LTNPCPLFKAGSILTQPPDLFSHNGTLKVSLDYQTIVDEGDGFSASNVLQLFCFAGIIRTFMASMKECTMRRGRGAHRRRNSKRSA